MEQLGTLATSTQIAEMKDSLNRLEDATGQLSVATACVAEDAQAIRSNITQLQQGLTELTAGQQRLKQGQDRLAAFLRARKAAGGQAANAPPNSPEPPASTEAPRKKGSNSRMPLGLPTSNLSQKLEAVATVTMDEDNPVSAQVPATGRCPDWPHHTITTAMLHTPSLLHTCLAPGPHAVCRICLPLFDVPCCTVPVWEGAHTAMPLTPTCNFAAYRRAWTSTRPQITEAAPHCSDPLSILRLQQQQHEPCHGSLLIPLLPWQLFFKIVSSSSELGA
jgi:hypothetical protein